MAILTMPEEACKPNRADRRDKHRRRRWESAVNKAVAERKITLQCRGWLSRLSEQSSDTMKPVWGMQWKQAQKCQRTDRMIRIYRAQAEQAGLIETKRAPVTRDSQGRFSRMATNMYVFLVPAAIRKKGKVQVTPSGNPLPPNKPHPTDELETLRRNHSFIVDDEPLESLPPIDPGGIRQSYAWLAWKR